MPCVCLSSSSSEPKSHLFGVVLLISTSPCGSIIDHNNHFTVCHVFFYHFLSCFLVVYPSSQYLQLVSSLTLMCVCIYYFHFGDWFSQDNLTSTMFPTNEKRILTYMWMYLRFSLSHADTHVDCIQFRKRDFISSQARPNKTQSILAEFHPAPMVLHYI